MVPGIARQMGGNCRVKGRKRCKKQYARRAKISYKLARVWRGLDRGIMSIASRSGSLTPYYYLENTLSGGFTRAPLQRSADLKGSK